MVDEMKNTWKPSDVDAFLVSVRGWVYYYAIKADLDGYGSHYYKRNKKISHHSDIIEVDQSEIVDIVQNHKENILKICPCVVIKDGKLVPLVTRNESSEKYE